MKVVCDCRKDARLPVQLQRAMAAEAEAAREARAKVRIFKIFIDLKSSQSLVTIISFLRLMRFHVLGFDGLLVISKQKKLILAINFFQVIAAEGEQKASKALREASEVIAESSSALQLRYLQVNIIVP